MIQDVSTIYTSLYITVYKREDASERMFTHLVFKLENENKFMNSFQ